MSAGWDTLGLEDGSSHTLAATATDDGGSPVADDLEPVARRLPHYLLLTARARPAAARHLGTAGLEGRPHELIHVVGANGEPLTLWIEREGLEELTIAGTHGRSGTVAELRAALEAAERR